MKLFYMPGACSLAPHIVLEWIGKPFELGRVERGKTREPEFIAVNPVGKVPALVEEDGRVLTEAEAILLYLAEKFPDRQLGASPTAEARYEMHKWMSYLTGDVHPAFYPYFLPHRYIEDQQQHPAIQEAAYKQIDACFQLLDRHMENRTYMVEDRRTILDPYLFVFCRWGNILPKPFTDYPNLHRFLTHFAEDEGVKQAMRAQGINR
ncbi:glutathione S-transferase N-terminal domain-containing protein (plasmid) [Kovacikia minuta CCNUW1]|uniref:glutathione S-transferase N-terminal domain-containing protein n=1 Tax=Kovacikia minuta TaxID=2931930 RepID=UPI001CCEBFA1|nr:glutathione S-transferase N-terminal domain-containing protein [Kovacikia minuta]UBF30402.1 glutathione S-transferase N-terminal domain-containing protein [Kovacikia minuta CCNUW1]